MNSLNISIVGKALPMIIADHATFVKKDGEIYHYSFPIGHLNAPMVLAAAAHYPLVEDDVVLSAIMVVNGIQRHGQIALSERAIETLYRLQRVRQAA